MTVTVASLATERQPLLEALGEVASLATASDQAGALNVLYAMVALRAQDGQLELTCADGTCWLTHRLPLAAPVSLSALVPARTLLGWLKLAGGQQVMLRRHERSFEIEDTVAALRLPTLPVEEFPAAPLPPEASAPIETEGPALAAALGAVLHAVYRGTDRPALGGVALRSAGPRLELLAADGYRLAVARLAARIPESVEAILPRQTAERLAALAERAETVRLWLAEGRLHAQAARAELASVLLDARFPAVQRIIEHPVETRVRVEREMLAERLRQALVAADTTRLVVLAMEAERLSLSTWSATFGQAEAQLMADGAGPELSLGLNAGYLLDALRALQPAERICIEALNPSAPVRLRPDGADDRLMVVMPMDIRKRGGEA